MDKLVKKDGQIVLTGDANNPADWGMYSFEVLPNRHDMPELETKEKIKYAIALTVMAVIYFGICFAI